MNTVPAPHVKCNCFPRKTATREIPKTARQLLGWCESWKATITHHKSHVTLVVPGNRPINEKSLGAAIRKFLKDLPPESPYL